ncbi:MAG: hypothetical protein EVA89_00425 [Sandaracinaceae bacterium]|nr:MAG: hypothetical protein EVA89_00425 [Sandaracinaceae bacterium]
MTFHPIQRRFLAEDLVRVRPADEQRRYVASQRSGRIDPNPHQIEAVIFALKRIPEGGCILADEVGLGKTIEAGLVIAQLLAEGAERILLITPKALLGQWRQELFTLFSITATEYEPGVDLAVPGVFLVTRDFAGGEKGTDVLGGVPPFDLCVIDEAHEIFAGIYKRFDRYGAYLPDSDKAKMAGRVRSLLLETPVLLLTATPIQNSLTELWGLVQFVEPTGTLLGNLATFREMFTAGDDRRLADGQERELQKRVAEICQRTLRRQAQEFMKRPFVERRTRRFDYPMSVEERALYEDVTAYLLQPGICAFRGNQRRLLLIGFHRRMASSVPALAASLERVAERLEKMLTDAGALDDEATAAAMLDDLEEDEIPDEEDIDESQLPPPEVIEAELQRVRRFVERARSLPSDAKAQALVRAVRTVLERAERGEGDGKVVVFTESITTQNYLREVLRESGLVDDEEITLFRGQNDGPRPMQALERWREEEMAHLPKTAHPTREIATRLALVHEFRTRGKVFVSTEAGAKGLNLQFAGTLINYDLPWNPQRIEQRIGRIHRYGQTKDVLVINFAAEDNEAQKLTLEILTQKLDLFGTVLGASDEVLHEPTSDAPETIAGALGAEFETRLRRIYQNARSQEEIEKELVALRETMAEERARFEETHERTAGLIESRFDDRVKQVFHRIQDVLPGELAAFDRHLERVVTAYLDAIGATYTREEVENGARLRVDASERLPDDLRTGFVAHLGDARGAEDIEPLHLGHPLLRAALDEARSSSAEPFTVRLQAPDGLEAGARGRLRLLKVRYAGYEALEELVPVGLLEGSSDPMEPAEADSLLHAAATDAPGLVVEIEDDDLDDAVEEVLFVAEEAVSSREQERFSRAVQQIETSMEDRVLLLERQRADAVGRLADAESKRDAAVGADARTKAEKALERRETTLEKINAELERLRQRDDEEYTRWMKRAHERRSRPPVVETLLEIRFELVGADE